MPGKCINRCRQQHEPPRPTDFKLTNLCLSGHMTDSIYKLKAEKRYSLLRHTLYRVTKKRELLKNPTKIEEIKKKKLLTENLTITTCLLKDSNPNYQCLKITSCRWRPPPVCILSLPLRISKVPVLLCHPVCVACSAECDRVAFTHRVTQKNGNF